MATAVATITENECPYCHNHIHSTNQRNDLWDYVKCLNEDGGWDRSPDEIYISSDNCLMEIQYETGPYKVAKIHYCPMCGRKLSDK